MRSDIFCFQIDHLLAFLLSYTSQKKNQTGIVNVKLIRLNLFVFFIYFRLLFSYLDI